jgi:uncharacterized protein YehS (DUF1456 family)
MRPRKEIQDIVNNEIEQRRVKDEKLRFCTRRLHISKNYSLQGLKVCFNHRDN